MSIGVRPAPGETLVPAGGDASNDDDEAVGPARRRPSRRSRFVLAAAVGAILVALMAWSPWSGDGDRIVDSGTTGDDSGAVGASISGRFGASPAVPVDLPGRSPGAVGGVSGEGLEANAVATGSGTTEVREGHVESVGNHSVVVVPDGPDQGGLVITNSGSAVADSGDNTHGGGEGSTNDVQTGNATAEGNRSSTQVGP